MLQTAEYMRSLKGDRKDDETCTRCMTGNTESDARLMLLIWCSSTDEKLTGWWRGGGEGGIPKTIEVTSIFGSR